MSGRSDRRAPILDRARADLAAGRPQTAVDRLQSYLAQSPLSPEERLLLGATLLELGQLERAGRALLPSERTDPEALAAIAAWEATLEPLGSKALKSVRGTGLLHPHVIRKLGPVGRARMEPIADRVRPILEERGELPASGLTTAGEKVVLGGCSLVGTAIVAVFGVGLVQIVKWFAQ